jgi:hypothetical protein
MAKFPIDAPLERVLAGISRDEFLDAYENG